jgi:hypothetical protein
MLLDGTLVPVYSGSGVDTILLKFGRPVFLSCGMYDSLDTSFSIFIALSRETLG